MYVPNSLWVLFYFSSDEALWYAHALDFDLVASGAGPREAWDELKDAVLTQIAFAVRRRETDLIERPAPPDYFRRWQDALKTNVIPESALMQWLDPKLDHVMFVALDQYEIARAVEETAFERESESAHG